MTTQTMTPSVAQQVNMADPTVVIDPVLRVAPPRRLKGLRFPVLPTGSWLAQVGGGISAAIGCYLTFGPGITMIAVGVAAALLGALKEAGKI